ncbi:aminoglycoside phosphotransferase [Actinacidiphila glaucinigra]|uniref:aminoglycoside phosphotransferase n=1 Tax=Actinacidiphila glaucinigra TaxID=235986 RepID=UPI0038641019
MPRATDAVPPPPRVLEAFGLSGRPEPLEGGQGRSVRVGDAVLKPGADAAETEWAAGLMERLQGRRGFRVPRFLRSADGAHVYEGWAATEFLTGEPGPAGRWPALPAAGRAFHEALHDVPRPAHLDARRHPWAVADRLAWGEATARMPADARRLAARLERLRAPVEARAGLIHGDLTGNVLFAAGRDPAVIDFSPYWRPAAYADAIVAVDGLLHHGAPHHLVDSAVPGAEGAQMLLRALMFRLAASALLAGPGAAALPGDELAGFTRVAELVERRVGGRP